VRTVGTLCATTDKSEVGQFEGAPKTGEQAMLYWALVFFIVAIVAGAFGFFGIAAGAAGIAKILFFVFLVLFLVSLLTGMRPRGTI
jgi:uncharacterized membrane protein YtjA (UPF0391 family)